MKGKICPEESKREIYQLRQGKPMVLLRWTHCRALARPGRVATESSLGFNAGLPLPLSAVEEVPMKGKLDKQAIEILNHILEMELAGAIHYTHYSFMVYGYNRIPIVKW